MPSPIKDDSVLCVRCILGHKNRPDSHEKLSQFIYHGNSLCKECYLDTVKLHLDPGHPW